MRDSSGTKIGALSPEECYSRAKALIAEHGSCLFFIDLIDSRKLNPEERTRTFVALRSYIQEATETYGYAMPVNSLATIGKEDRGFVIGLGDAAWVGIDDAEIIPKLIELKDTRFPELRLHYGVAADGWSPGVEIIR